MIKRKRHIKDICFYVVSLIFATLVILFTFGIILFVSYQGIRPFLANNVYETPPLLSFLSGDVWRPSGNVYGIGYMILSSVVATFWSIAISAPISLATAIFIVEYAPSKIGNVLKFVIECLAGIPSVFYGIFGFIVILPFIQQISPYPHGESLLAVIIILAVMAMPSMTLIIMTSLMKVPKEYKEGALALATSRRQSIISVLVPAAKPGIIIGIALGASRVIGEAMAVALIAGNREGGFATSIFSSVRLLTTNIILEQGYAAGLHEQLLWSSALILLFFILLINVIIRIISK